MAGPAEFIMINGKCIPIQTGATAHVGPRRRDTGFHGDYVIDSAYLSKQRGTPGPWRCDGVECASDTYRVRVRARTLDVEINIGIDEGLWWLHRTQNSQYWGTDGRWTANNVTAATAEIGCAVVPDQQPF